MWLTSCGRTSTCLQEEQEGAQRWLARTEAGPGHGDVQGSCAARRTLALANGIPPARRHASDIGALPPACAHCTHVHRMMCFRCMSAQLHVLTQLGSAHGGPDVTSIHQAAEEGLDGVGRHVGLQQQRRPSTKRRPECRSEQARTASRAPRRWPRCRESRWCRTAG